MAWRVLGLRHVAGWGRAAPDSNAGDPILVAAPDSNTGNSAARTREADCGYRLHSFRVG